MRDLLVIAEHAPSVRSLRFALREAPGFCVVATLDGRTSVRDELVRLRPEVVLVDASCQRANVMARVREVRSTVPSARVVVLASGAKNPVVEDAFACGAHAALDRNLPPRRLAVALVEAAGRAPSRGRRTVPAARPGREAAARLEAWPALQLVRDQDAEAGTTA